MVTARVLRELLALKILNHQIGAKSIAATMPPEPAPAYMRAVEQDIKFTRRKVAQRSRIGNSTKHAERKDFF